MTRCHALTGFDAVETAGGLLTRPPRFLLACLMLLGICLHALPGWASTSSNKALQTHEQGREIYNYRCYFCHGYSGDARTLTSTYMDPPPRNFRATDPAELSRETMIATVRDGKPNTGMHGFSRLLDAEEIEAVVDFVRVEFIQHRRENTRYHTDANGWPDHDRYLAAFPFATGDIALDTPWEELDPEQTRGKQLFLTSCITCHDRAIVNDEGVVWSKQSISYPRNNFSYSEIDAVSGASIYAQHDIIPDVAELSDSAVQGRQLWQDNCAFCHAADGTGENWIGSFLDPKPRNLTDPAFMRHIDRDILSERIREGIRNTSMPAWKNVLDENQISSIIDYIDAAFHPVKNKN